MKIFLRNFKLIYFVLCQICDKIIKDSSSDYQLCSNNSELGFLCFGISWHSTQCHCPNNYEFPCFCKISIYFIEAKLIINNFNETLSISLKCRFLNAEIKNKKIAWLEIPLFISTIVEWIPGFLCKLQVTLPLFQVRPSVFYWEFLATVAICSILNTTVKFFHLNLKI